MLLAEIGLQPVSARDCCVLITFQTIMTTIEKIKEQIRFYPDYPKKGINFIDVLPVLSNSETFSALMEEINHNITSHNVAAPEARGFLFGAPLLLLGKVHNFITFRKNSKLPAAENDLQKVSIVKEYGDDSLYYRISDIENARPSGGVIEISIFDDILATGGTAEGMARHLNALTVTTREGTFPVRVKEFVFLAEIADLKGKERLEKIAPVKSLISF